MTDKFLFYVKARGDKWVVYMHFPEISGIDLFIREYDSEAYALHEANECNLEVIKDAQPSNNME